MIEKLEYTFIKKIGELSDDGVVIFDTQQLKFIYANTNFSKIVNVPFNSLLDNADIVVKLIMAEDDSYLRLKYSELLAEGFINTTEFRLLFEESNIKHISADAFMVEDNRYIVAYIKDITKIKKHEDYLIKYMAQKDTILDMLTHNLSGSLILSKDLITKAKNDILKNNTESVSRVINMLSENTQDCIDIVSDFLNEEYSESPLIYVRNTRFDLIEKIKATLKRLKEMNKDKTFILKTELQNFNITSDPVKFFQIIHIILSNSIKFTNASGIIEIDIDEEELHYTVSVKDNGIGIPNLIQQIIFQDKILGSTGIKGEKSNGLGLFIANKLVNLLGGDIRFESEENVGSSFYIRFPKEVI